MEHAVAAPCKHNGFSCGQEKVPHIWQFLLERVAVSASASVIQYAGFPDCQNQFNMQHAPKICESTRSQSHQKSRLHLQHENVGCILQLSHAFTALEVLIQTGPCGLCRL